VRAVSTNETARKRAHVAPKRDSTAVVKRNTLAADGAGGFTDSWATIGTYSARVAPNTTYNFPVEIVRAAQLKGTSVWAIALPWNADVTVSDYIEVGSDHFEVVGTNDAKSPLTEILLTCYKVE
jgi:hypothetical protein